MIERLESEALQTEGSDLLELDSGRLLCRFCSCSSGWFCCILYSWLQVEGSDLLDASTGALWRCTCSWIWHCCDWSSAIAVTTWANVYFIDGVFLRARLMAVATRLLLGLEVMAWINVAVLIQYPASFKRYKHCLSYSFFVSISALKPLWVYPIMWPLINFILPKPFMDLVWYFRFYVTVDLHSFIKIITLRGNIHTWRH